MARSSRYRYYLFLEPSLLSSLIPSAARSLLSQKPPFLLLPRGYLLHEDRETWESLTPKNEPLPRKDFFPPTLLTATRTCRKSVPVSSFVARRGQYLGEIGEQRDTDEERCAPCDWVERRRIRASASMITTKRKVATYSREV